MTVTGSADNERMSGHGGCDEIECYTRWQALNCDRDGYLDRALTAEMYLEKPYARGVRSRLARRLIRSAPLAIHDGWHKECWTVATGEQVWSCDGDCPQEHPWE